MRRTTPGVAATAEIRARSSRAGGAAQNLGGVGLARLTFISAIVRSFSGSSLSVLIGRSTPPTSGVGDAVPFARRRRAARRGQAAAALRASRRACASASSCGVSRRAPRAGASSPRSPFPICRPRSQSRARPSPAPGRVGPAAAQEAAAAPQAPALAILIERWRRVTKARSSNTPSFTIWKVAPGRQGTSTSEISVGLAV